MRVVLLILLAISSIGLIVLVLLHSAKGEGLGSIGNTARMFATQKGLEDGLNKMTAICAVVFFVSTLMLGFIK